MANEQDLVKEIERAIGFVQEYEFLASDKGVDTGGPERWQITRIW